jgi:predicted transposase YdaD
VKTDSLFYDLFQQFPQSFFELIGASEANIDAYEFISPEIKQSAFSFVSGKPYAYSLTKRRMKANTIVLYT